MLLVENAKIAPSMIAVLDVNIIAGRKLAEALVRRGEPMLRCSVRAIGQARSANPGESSITLPPSWAGRLAQIAMPWVLRLVDRMARNRQSVIQTIIVTIPQYLPLAQRAWKRANLVYYCSDDFRAYSGWNSAKIVHQERALCRGARLSIFVSEALRARAIAEYALDPEKTLVLPNASEPRFAASPPPPPPSAIAALPGPVFGVAGVFTKRIDVAFLAAIASDPRVGTLALVGPIDLEIKDTNEFGALLATGKVQCFGRQEHGEMHAWMAAFDVALIPYAATEFNRLCSPMRLYDHLAIGQPIIATPCCDQVAARPEVLIATISTLPAAIGAALTASQNPRRPLLETWDDRIEALRDAAPAGFLFHNDR